MRVPLALFNSTNNTAATIAITSNQTALNLKTLYELSYPPAISGDSVIFNASASLIFSSSTQSTSPTNNAPPAIRTGVWASGVSVRLNMPSCENTAAGGSGTGPSSAAMGGTAFLAESPITIDAPGSTFNGGGGGGAGTDQHNSAVPPFNNYSSSGGGGAGRPAGGPGTPIAAVNMATGASGTTTTGGAGGNFGSDPDQPGSIALAGAGGALGIAGQNAGDVALPGSTDNIGGPAGYSVDGLSLVTWVTAPTLVGPTNG
jgi:hypothetical protein